VYTAGLVAARPLGGCPVRRVLAYETLSETEWARPGADTVFQPTVFIDIEPFLEQKIEAMSCYQSKLVPAPHPRSLETIRALARLRGSTAHLEAAEAFMLIREIQETSESPTDTSG
jgi:LmbE family N-acetylglucosaminyl deacetylase